LKEAVVGPAQLQLLAVATDGLNWATGQGFFAQGALVIVLGLFENVGVATVIVAGEVSRCCLAAEIAVDALIIHVIGSRGVLRVLVFDVCHVLVRFV
jgi:hypothetical protein